MRNGWITLSASLFVAILGGCAGEKPAPVKVDVCGPLVEKLAQEDMKAVDGVMAELLQKKGECLDAVKKAVGHSSVQVRTRAAELLGRVGDPAGLDALATAMKDEDPKVRAAAADAMKKFTFAQVSGVVEQLLGAEDFKVRVVTVGVLKELNDPASIPLLIKALSDKHGGVRNAVYEVIAGIGPAGVAGLLKEYESTTSEADRRMLIVALGRTKDTAVVDTLVKVLQGEEIRLRNAAACAMSDIKDPRTVEPLLAAVQDANAPVRACAAKALGTQGDPRAVPLLINLLQKDTFDHVKAMAAYALGKLADDRAMAVLIKGLKDDARSVRYHCVAALSNYAKPNVVAPLAAMLADEEVRAHAVASLVKLGPLSTAAMVKSLKNPDAAVAAASATVLGRIGDRTAVKSLVGALSRTETNVQQQVSTALRMLTGQNFGMDAAAWTNWLKDNA